MAESKDQALSRLSRENEQLRQSNHHLTQQNADLLRELAALRERGLVTNLNTASSVSPLPPLESSEERVLRSLSDGPLAHLPRPIATKSFPLYFHVPRRGITTRIELFFDRVDYGVLFGRFLTPDFLRSGTDDVELRALSCVSETNRCFFLHLGVATSIHPFALQTAFRGAAVGMVTDTNVVAEQERDPWDIAMEEPLESILAPASFVDAQALIAIWPAEFDDVRVLVVKLYSNGDLERYNFFGPHGSWSENDEDGNGREFHGEWKGRDVVLLNQNGHFTILRPRDAGSTLQALLNLAIEYQDYEQTLALIGRRRPHSVRPQIAFVHHAARRPIAVPAAVIGRVLPDPSAPASHALVFNAYHDEATMEDDYDDEEEFGVDGKSLPAVPSSVKRGLKRSLSDGSNAVYEATAPALRRQVLCILSLIRNVKIADMVSTYGRPEDRILVRQVEVRQNALAALKAELVEIVELSWGSDDLSVVNGKLADIQLRVETFLPDR